MKLCGIVIKIGTRICLNTPYKCTKFKPDWSIHLRVRANFVICAKRRREKKTKVFHISEKAGTIYFNLGM